MGRRLSLSSHCSETLEHPHIGGDFTSLTNVWLIIAIRSAVRRVTQKGGTVARYDLRERDWLPVLLDGKPHQVGLVELFERAHEFTDLAVSLPPAASGLWRVLYAIAARISGLHQSDDDIDEWFDRRAEALAARRFPAEEISKYFDGDGTRFDLFDDVRPWMQDPRLADQCPKAAGVNKLVVSRPSGNNQVFFGHHVDADPEPVPTPDAVLYLLVWHYYGPSGRCSSRTVGTTTAADTSAGPLRRTISYHPVGATVFESLLVGLVPPASLGIGSGDDLCPWERDDLPDPVGLVRAPGGFCGRLTSRSQHALLLTPAPDYQSVVDARITWGRRDRFPVSTDPYLVSQVSQAGDWYIRRADADRALWRDLDALLRQARGGDEKVRQPIAFQAAAELPADLLSTLRVRAFGFDQDGQTRDRQWFTAVTPPILDRLGKRDPDAALWIAELRESAEDVQRRLAGALRDVWRAATMPPTVTGAPGKGAECPWLRPAAARYWPAAERLFWRQVNDGRDGHAARRFVELGVRVFDDITDSAAAAPRVARVRGRARGLILAALPRKAA